MIDQITVFLENSEGRLAQVSRAVADAGVNMLALTIADTSDYGVVRIVCTEPAKAKDALEAAGFRAILTKVVAVSVPNVPGGLANLLEAFDKLNLNIEYGYCFSFKGEKAIDVLKVHGAEQAIEAIEAAGFELIHPADLV